MNKMGCSGTMNEQNEKKSNMPIFTFDIHRGLTHTLPIARGDIVSTEDIGEDLIFLPSSTCPPSLSPSTSPAALPISTSPAALPSSACFDRFRGSWT